MPVSQALDQWESSQVGYLGSHPSEMIPDQNLEILKDRGPTRFVVRHHLLVLFSGSVGSWRVSGRVCRPGRIGGSPCDLLVGFSG